MKILVIEDSRELQRELKDILNKDGYEVETVGSCQEAIDAIHNQSIDLCLMDIGLPDGSGFDLCREIRNYYKNPVIMLTSYDGEEDIIEGLNAGADDYVPKPFSIGVLRSRIASQMRRRNWDEEQRNKVYFSGDLKINFENKKFYRNGEPVQLRAMEIEICEVLIRNYGRLVTRELLLENLWDAKNNFIEDNTLSVHISRIRRKLQKYEGKDYIETVKGIGYRWNIEVNKN